MTENLKNKLLHPYLLVFYFILKGIIELKAAPNTWLDPLIILLSLLFAAFCLLKISQFMSLNPIKSGIIITLFLFSLLFSLPIFKTLNYWFPALIDRVRYGFMASMACTCLLSILIVWSKKTFINANYYLNLLFILFSIVDISIYLINKRAFNELDTAYLSASSMQQNRENYNIYLFVPDGYGGNYYLKNNWQYDNTDFTNYLKEKGFYIAQKPQSNYYLSAQTMSSCLNLNYLSPETSEAYLSHSIANNKVAHILSKLEYDCFMYDHSGNYSDYDSSKNKLNFNRYYIEQTIYPFINRMSKVQMYKPLEEKKDANVFDESEQIINNRQAKKQFIYAHSRLTHPPFLSIGDTLDAYSKQLTTKIMQQMQVEVWLKIPHKTRSLSQEDAHFLRDRYCATITKTNNLLTQTLDKQWAKIAYNSIVIIMSDHGSRILSGTPKDVIEDMYGNFCAVYFPDRDYSAFNDTITPINVMRMSLNKAIGAHLLYLPDKSEKFGLFH